MACIPRGAYIHCCIIHMCSNWSKKLLDGAERASELTTIDAGQCPRKLALDPVHQLGPGRVALDPQWSRHRHHAAAIGGMIDAPDQTIGFETVDQLRDVRANARDLGRTLG